MTAMHTSGPWIRHNGTIYQAREDGGKFYAETAIAGVFTKEDELLIAAAPDLLQELKNIANADTAEWDDPTEFEAWAKNRARAAIAKATGEAK